MSEEPNPGSDEAIAPPGYLYEHIMSNEHTLSLLEDPLLPLGRN